MYLIGFDELAGFRVSLCSPRPDDSSPRNQSSFAHGVCSADVSFGDLKLLRQTCFRGERLVPPFTSTTIAVSLPWGCNPHVGSSLPNHDFDSPNTHATSILSPECLVRKTVSELLVPFDLYFRELTHINVERDPSALQEVDTFGQSGTILDIFGLWCRHYCFLVDGNRAVSYLCMELASTSVMRMLKTFTATVQFSQSVQDCAGAPTVHNRRFVVLPLYSSLCLKRDGSALTLFTDSKGIESERLVSPHAFYEIPSCLVCLDRLDVSISGLIPRLYGITIESLGELDGPLSVVCAEPNSIRLGRSQAQCVVSEDRGAQNHLCTCLVGSACPMCRLLVGYLKRDTNWMQAIGVERHECQNEEWSVIPPIASLPKRVACNDCDIDDDLYQCLLCGHIGCSRYRAQHARKHFCSTKRSQNRVEGCDSPLGSGAYVNCSDPKITSGFHAHSFSLCLASQEIWDYDSDAFAHRLVTRIPPNSLGSVRQAVYTLPSGEPWRCDTRSVGVESGVPLVVGGDERDHQPLCRSDANEKSVSLHESIFDSYLSPSNEKLQDTFGSEFAATVQPPPTTDVTSLKYDAKVEQLCSSYTGLLAYEMSAHRRSFEERLYALISGPRTRPGTEQSKSPSETERSILKAALEEHASASGSFSLYHRNVSRVDAVNADLRARESSIHALISEEKSALHSIILRRSAELSEREAEISSINEMIAEIGVNLRTRRLILENGGVGAEGLAVLERGEGGKGRYNRGRGARR